MAAAVGGSFLNRSGLAGLDHQLDLDRGPGLDGLALVPTGPRANRPVLERAYNICSDLGLVAATLVHGGLAEVEAMKVRPGPSWLSG